MVIVMLVSLKIPDATALTAARTLQEMGYSELKGLHRAAYYEFEIDGDERAFKQRISKTDLLVNANKHTSSFDIPKKGVSIAVMDIEQGEGLAATLKERLGFTEIKSATQGTLWTFDIQGSNERESAEIMTKELLANLHYQQYKVVGQW